MRQNNRLLPLALALLIFTACASTLSKTPKWFLSPTQKKGYIYAVGTEKGNEMQNALDEATDVAARRLSQTIESDMEANSKRVQEEIKDIAVTDTYDNIQSSVMAASMNNWKVVKQDVVPESGLFRAYVMIQWNKGAAYDILMEKFEAEEELNQRFRKTELWKDMKKEVDAYRKRRGN
tara:strand:- start:7993 stop:8526 length:534 start_codon:yes stop_codon:yes gene_type:complete